MGKNSNKRLIETIVISGLGVAIGYIINFWLRRISLSTLVLRRMDLFQLQILWSAMREF